MNLLRPITLAALAGASLLLAGRVPAQEGVPALHCEAEGDTVHLSWEPLVPDPSLAAGAVLLRDGETIAHLAPGDVSYDDIGVPQGDHVYQLVVTTADGVSRTAECRVTVVEGFGVQCTVAGRVVTIRWEPLPLRVVIDGYTVTRNGVLVATLPPDALSYREEPPPGEHLYSVAAFTGAGDPGLPPRAEFLVGTCRVMVGEIPRVECSVEGSLVTVRWTVPDDIFALGFLISRDNQIVATLGPDARAYREEAPPGPHVYTVSTNNRLPGGGPPDFLIGSCQVVVGEGFGIRCEVAGLVVSIHWDPLTIDVALRGFRVSRDGETAALLGPDALSYREEAPPGVHDYTVTALTAAGEPDPAGVPGGEILVGSCRVTVEGEGLPPPQRLECAVAESFPLQLQLFWVNPVRYDSILVARDGRQIAVLPGDATRFTERDPPAGRHLYEVFGTRAGARSLPARCDVEIPGAPVNRLLLASPPAAAGENAALPGDSLRAMLENVDPVQAWSFGVCSDPAVLEVAEATVEGTATALLNEGEGPTFLDLDVLAEGVTMGVVIDERDPADVLPPGGRRALLALRYRPGPEALPGERYQVEYCGELGDPPVVVILVVRGFEVQPRTSPGTIVFTKRFRRADSDESGEVNMTDGIHTLNWLFRGGTGPACLDAADANASGQVNIADPVFTFQALFSGGPPIPPPFPDCGPGRIVLGCDASSCE